MNNHIKFDKNETELKMGNLTYSSRVKNEKPCEIKKETFFLTFISSKGNFFNISVLSQCIVYWINFQRIHIFTYQKNITFYNFACFEICLFWSLQFVFKKNKTPLTSKVKVEVVLEQKQKWYWRTKKYLSLHRFNILRLTTFFFVVVLVLFV